MDGAANEQGLEAFLDVAPQEQWLLLVDLDGNLLPYDQIRIRDTELRDSPLPGKRLLVVENERCCHLLPRVEECLALLGAGLNLAWLEANWLGDRQIAYWGDIDTWGLTMLARAREKQPGLTPLLMSQAIFDELQERHAVPEPTPAGHDAPKHLSMSEAELFEFLVKSERGRLEQEFLPATLVHDAIDRWVHRT